MLAAPSLRHLLDARGGFTLDPSSGTPVERGVSVCMDPALSLSFGRSAWRDDVVASWLDSRADHLGRPGRYVGGWHDGWTGRVWLDIVRVFPGPARPLALFLARRHGQRGVYDLARRRLVLAIGDGV